MIPEQGGPVSSSHGDSIAEIDPTSRAVASRIVAIQRAAYAVEATLIGFDGIPQLTETIGEVQERSDLHWRGAHDGGQLVAIIAWSEEVDVVDIDRLAVDPSWARRGYGRRLVEAVPADRVTTVSTGTKNEPALALYLSLGFKRVDEIEIGSGVFVTVLRREPR